MVSTAFNAHKGPKSDQIAFVKSGELDSLRHKYSRQECSLVEQAQQCIKQQGEFNKRLNELKLCVSDEFGAEKAEYKALLDSLQMEQAESTCEPVIQTLLDSLSQAEHDFLASSSSTKARNLQIKTQSSGLSSIIKSLTRRNMDK